MILTALLASIAILSPTPANASIDIDLAHPGHAVPKSLWGIFFEEINCAGDGGLYAELVRNRSFEDSDQPDHWTLSGTGRPRAAILHRAPETSGSERCLELRLDGNGEAELRNTGYWGMATKKGMRYRLRADLWERNGNGWAEFAIESSTGARITETKRFSLKSGWTTFRTEFRANQTESGARLLVRIRGTSEVRIDHVSLLPMKTYPQNIRGDLFKMLKGLSPGFLRFPGGCWVEGETMEHAYRWKRTIGDTFRRRTQRNIWQYQSTNGLGFHEYLLLSESLGAEPLFVVNCGMSHREVVPLDRMGEFVQDALDAIEYANGPITSKWGALRAAAGHPEPFGLKMIEIGNENGGPAYEERYALFHDAIKAKHPEVILVANAWGGVPRNRPLEVIDEHYYSNPDFFFRSATRYDAYLRSGPKIYVGEYAVTAGCGEGNLLAAIAEAAYMTGIERNSDVIMMASYAPLFANVNYKKWNPNLINFDAFRVYGTPSYHVQALFAANRGDRVLPTRVQSPQVAPEVPAGRIGVGTWATRAEFRNIRVTSGGRNLFVSDFANGTMDWTPGRGHWTTEGDILRQSSMETNCRFTAGDATWTDYTLELQARKLGGNEGFLILVHHQNDGSWTWWNLGGWGNVRHAIQHSREGGDYILGKEVPGRIETGRWYDIRIEVEGPRIRCFLDGVLLHDASLDERPSLFASVTLDSKRREVIVKAVNASSKSLRTEIRFRNNTRLGPRAKATLLTSQNPTDENTLENPEYVAPKTEHLATHGGKLVNELPGYSLTVFRIPIR